LPFDLVIFDCDGVLIDSEIISAKMLVAELAKLGVSIDLDYVAKHFLGRSYPTVMNQIRVEFGLKLPPFCVATSSSPRRAETSLRLVGLDALTGPLLFTSTMVARGKPAPDLFLHAMVAMGMVDPARCLVIEDSLNGVRAARAAGMQVWRFTGGSHLADRVLVEPDDATPNGRFASFADFFQTVPGLRQKVVPE
jgi:beta-phosphoglucomutase-like phosphatase (HAD superfamily)